MGAAAPDGVMTRGVRLTLALAALAACCLAAAGVASARTVWLCKPGQRPDPCSVSLATTVFSPTLHKLRVIHPARDAKPAIDCFYVYPTVTDQKTPQRRPATSTPRSARSRSTRRRATRSDCRVFAPMYRQVTLHGATRQRASSPRQRDDRRTATCVAAWRDVPAQVQPRPRLRADRPLAGLVRAAAAHRQGDRCQARRAQAARVGDPARRQRDRSARQGRRRRLPAHPGVPLGDPARLRHRLLDLRRSRRRPTACSGARRHGPRRCSAPTRPRSAAAPPRSTRLPDRAVRAGHAHRRRHQPARRPAAAASTPWVSSRPAPTARAARRPAAPVCCRSPPCDGAPTPTPVPDPTWGLHLVDANIALGNLISVVHTEANAYAARPSAPLAPVTH